MSFFTSLNLFYKYTDQYCMSAYPKLMQRTATSAAFHFREIHCIKWISKYHNASYIDYIYGQNLCNNKVYDKILFLRDVEAFNELRTRDNGCDINIAAHDVTYEYILKAVELNSTYLLKTIESVDQITTHSIIRSNRYLLELAYQKQLLDVAHFLISRGATFYGKYIAHLTSLQSLDLKNHIDEIETYCQNSDIAQAKSTVAALSVQQETKLTWYNYVLKFFYESESKIRKDIEDDILKNIESHHSSIQDLFVFFSLFNLHSQDPLRIIVPDFAKKEDAFFHHGVSSPNYYISPYIYVANNRKHSASEIIHELGHALFYYLFQNGAKVYKKNDYIQHPRLFEAYKISVYQTLLLIYDAIKKKPPTKELSLELMITELSEDINMLLIQWYIESSGNGTVQPSTETSTYRKQIIVKSLNDSELSQKSEAEKESTLKLLVKSLATEDELYVIYRINDWLIRDLTEQDIELAIRLPELHSKKLSNPSLLLLTALEEWWDSYITPLVQDYTDDFFQQLTKKHIHLYTQDQLSTLFLIACSRDRVEDIPKLKVQFTEQTQYKVKKHVAEEIVEFCDAKKIKILKYLTAPSEFSKAIKEMYEGNPCNALRKTFSLYILLDQILEKDHIKYAWLYKTNNQDISQSEELAHHYQCTAAEFTQYGYDFFHNRPDVKLVDNYFGTQCVDTSMLRGEIDIHACSLVNVLD